MIPLSTAKAAKATLVGEIARPAGWQLRFPEPEWGLSDILSEFARTMLTDFPIQDILDHLVHRIVEVMPVSHVAFEVNCSTLCRSIRWSCVDLRRVANQARGRSVHRCVPNR